MTDTRKPEKNSALPDQHEKVQGIAVSALQRIELLGLQPTPMIYEIWYRYFQGDPEIVRVIEHHDGPIDEAACHRIYKRHLNEGARDEAVKKIGDQMQSSITQLANMLVSARTATTDFGSTLGGMTQKLNTVETLEDMNKVVSSIIDDTRRMVEKNKELETQLVYSSQQVSELKSSLTNVQKEALTDGLTGLANRKAFDKIIQDTIDEMKEIGAPFVLLMTDIDYFKKFNDTFGHQVGDQVLRLVARTLVDNVKGRDTAARYGGEEFAIILPETPLSAGVRVAEVLRKSVQNKEVVNKASGENLGRISLSIGVAEHAAGESASDLISRADAALYEAKHAGRNRVSEAAPRE